MENRDTARDPNTDFHGGDEVDPELRAAYAKSRRPQQGSEMLDTTLPGKVGNRVTIQPFNRTQSGAVGAANILGPGALSTVIAAQGAWTKSRLVTLSLSRDMRTSSGAIHKGPMVARVQFGAGGVTRFVEVDVPFPGSTQLLPDGTPDFAGQGCAFLTIPACGLQVNVRDDSMLACAFSDETGAATQAQDGAGANAQYTGINVYAHMAYGGIQHTGDHVPKRSVVFGNGAGGAWNPDIGVEVPVPPSARKVRFFQGSGCPATMSVRWVLFNGLLYTVALSGPGPNDIDVPSGATEMLVFNDDSGAATNPVMVIEFDIEP